MSNTPAGWYPDPERPGARRYWDGAAWTEHRDAPARTTVAPGPARKLRRKTWALIATGTVVVLALVVALGVAVGRSAPVDTAADKPDATGRGSTTTAPTPTSSATAAPVPTPAPTKSATPPPSPSPTKAPTAAPVAPTVTGYGATTSAWLTKHQQAAGYDKGSAFLPMVTTADGGRAPKYGGVEFETPVVLYSIALPAHTSLSEAQAIALQEFPAGARFGQTDKQEAACLIATVRSTPAEASMRAHGYTGSVPGAAFSSDGDGGLDTNNVSSIIMLPLQPEGADLGMC